MPQQDIFDRLMATRLLRRWQPLYQKHKAVLLYLLFGGLTTVISIGTFWVGHNVLQLNEHLANVISWVLAVLFAFLTNRVWVFSAPTNSTKAFLGQLFRFYGGRLTTLGIEEILLFVFITVLKINGLVVKVGAQVVVLILNYIVSKWFVFKNKK